MEPHMCLLSVPAAVVTGSCCACYATRAQRANAALANMDAARERSQMALNPQANPLPPRAQLRLAFGVRAAAGASLGGGPGSPGAGASADADLAHVIAGHGNIIIVPDRDVDDGQRGVEAGEAS